MLEGTVWSLLPVVVALVLAFATRNAVFSLLVGSVVGVVMLGSDPFTGTVQLMQDALGSGWFIWVVMIQVFVGILIAYFMLAGVTERFAELASERVETDRGAQGMTWLLGVLVFFSDYFSPLLSGPVMRPVTDEHDVSREKLAYLLDSTSAAVPTLIPISGWAVFIAGLIAEQGNVADKTVALDVFVNSIMYNFYGIFSIAFAGIIAAGVISDFGPMGKAERRARESGKVLRDGANPLVGVEIEEIEAKEGKTASLLLHLFVPVLIILGISIGTFVVLQDVKILAAFMAATTWLGVVMYAQGYFDDVTDLIDTSTDGIKGVFPAIMVLSLAYMINEITGQLGAPDFVIGASQGWLTPALLLFVTFVTGAFISFFSGTSWGTYGIMIPIIVPVAFSMNGTTFGPVLYAAVAAVVGGGLFGDHCSPLSDTSILSSFGAASDHMDHVRTQLPYAIAAGGVAAVSYAVLGVVIAP
ncbi:Na+/H+ antiporter NhaC family protein [Haloarchaeobius sp. HRN-SO-5]|uniref:Na+/H+ antiporter NhaC family protein n=1 Tax=Haloarchaeobius sp. HRN-SO-5 TaxID=3446118 RepID=UPI003EB9599F